jgi:hypothetical protein
MVLKFLQKARRKQFDSSYRLCRVCCFFLPYGIHDARCNSTYSSGGCQRKTCPQACDCDTPHHDGRYISHARRLASLNACNVA